MPCCYVKLHGNYLHESSSKFCTWDGVVHLSLLHANYAFNSFSNNGVYGGSSTEQFYNRNYCKMRGK